MLKKQVNETEMLELSAALAQHANALRCITLSGDLGAGKTTFTRGFLHALGYEGLVKSPTFTIVEPYSLATHNIMHFDLYRIESERELEDFGFYDYFTPQNTCLIEWPERAPKLLTFADITITINFLADSEDEQEARIIEFSANSSKGEQILANIKKNTANLI